MPSRPLLYDSLNMLNLVGLGPYKNTLGQNLRKLVTLFIIYVSCLDVVSSCIFEWKGVDSKEDVLAAIIIVQLVFKTFALSMTCKETIALVGKINKFWNLDKFGDEQQKKLNKIFFKVSIFIKILLASLLIIIVSFAAKPLFKTGIGLPYGSLLFNSNTEVSKITGIVYQYVTMYVISLTQISIDGLFIAFITNIICELKLIKVGFIRIHINGNVKGTEKRTLNQLKELIEHHNLILGTIKQMKRLYSPLLLIIFAINMFTIVSCLLCIFTSGFRLSDIPALFTFGTTALFYVTQLFIYCAPGSQLISESMAISDAVYNTQWWIKTQPELRKAYVMVIQRANKPEILTAGGLINVNLEGFSAILNASFSFLTFVRTVIKEKRP